MRNKAIVYAGGFVLPDKNAAANRVVSNGKIFNSLGYKTYFLGASQTNEIFKGIREIDGFENMYEQARPKSSVQWIKHMFSTESIERLADEAGNVGTVILYNAPFFTLLKAKKVFKKKNVKVCYDCTEWTKDTDGSSLKKIFKVIDEFLIRNFAHKVADKMIVISNMMAKKYKKSEPIIIPPLVDVKDEIWHQDREKISDIFEFCFAGVPDGNKESLDKVVEAFCSVNKTNTRLRIVGITKNEFKKIYTECRIPDNFNDKIIFMGKLSHRETVKYILNCDCYIFIRISDRRNNAGFPTKFAESFTCNVPIITTNVSDVAEYIKRTGDGFLINDMTVSNIKNAMLTQINKGKQNKGKNLLTDFHYEEYKETVKIWLEK